MKSIKKFFLIALLLTMVLTIGCTQRELSMVQETEKAKENLDFVYVAPSYLPKGYKLVNETYSPAKRVEFDNGEESFSSGLVRLEYEKPPGDYIRFMVTSIPNHGPYDNSNNIFEIKGVPISIGKTDNKENRYMWKIEEQGSIYYLETDNDTSLNEVKKIISSTLNK